MNLSAVNNPTLSTKNVLSIAQPADVSDRFAALMRRSQSGGPTPRVEQAARQLVGLALFKPLLEQARQSPFKTDLFHGGAGEDAFAGQLDQLLADRMAQRPDYPLVKAIVRQFSQQAKAVDTHG
ncbi:MAG: rod-binding protein [Phycisphaeraceae bacterium]